MTATNHDHDGYNENCQFGPTPVSEIALARGDPYRISWWARYFNENVKMYSYAHLTSLDKFHQVGHHGLSPSRYWPSWSLFVAVIVKSPLEYSLCINYVTMVSWPIDRWPPWWHDAVNTAAWVSGDSVAAAAGK